MIQAPVIGALEEMGSTLIYKYAYICFKPHFKTLAGMQHRKLKVQGFQRLRIAEANLVRE